VQFTVRQVSKFLNVTESTIARWIKQRGLPAQHVGGQYRFHRAEVLEWATANQIRVALEMFDEPEMPREPAPSLAAALEAGGIHYGLEDTNKECALRAVVNALPLPDGTDRELLFRLFQAREAAASTGIGDGIAIPHVRNPIVLNVDQPIVSLCFLKQPVDFGALDGRPVQVLFSLICPTTRDHLQMLSRLSYALHDSRFKKVVARQGEREEILAEIHRIEEALTLPGVKPEKAAS
jgi:nitrogen PTS system EIIA component